MDPKSPVPATVFARPEAMKNLRSGAIRGLRRGEVLKLRSWDRGLGAWFFWGGIASR